jgi:hypothetical protein
MSALERSHAELGAALSLAGKEIRKLNFGRAYRPVCIVLRRARCVLREALPSPEKGRNPSREAETSAEIEFMTWFFGAGLATSQVARITVSSLFFLSPGILSRISRSTFTWSAL